MHAHVPLRRTFAIASCGALTAALAWLPAGPATAAAAANEFAAFGQSNSNYTGPTPGQNCNASSGTPSVTSPIATFATGTKRRSVDLDATFTNSTNAGDTTRVTGHYDATLSVAARHGSLKSFRMAGDGNLAINRAAGSASQCDTSASIGGEAQSQFNENNAGWLYVKRITGSKLIESIFALTNSSGQEVSLDLFVGHQSSENSRVFLRPGTYGIPLWEILLLADSSVAARSVPLSNSISGHFYKAGAALASARGSARKYVAFPGSVTCGTRKATLRWKSGARKVDSGSFYVNGAKKASVSTPRAGHHIVLRHLSRTADTKITAKLKLKSGKTATATRSYVPCKA